MHSRVHLITSWPKLRVILLTPRSSWVERQVSHHVTPCPLSHQPILLTTIMDKEQGIDTGARLDVSVSKVCTRDDVEAVAADIAERNSHLNVESLMENATFDNTGALMEW